MTASTTLSAIEPGVNALAFARGVTTRLAEDIAEDVAEVDVDRPAHVAESCIAVDAGVE